MGIHDACPIHEEAYRICGCEERGGEEIPHPDFDEELYEEMFWSPPDYDLARDIERGK